MHSFTEYYRFRWFALNIADGDFSYLWYGIRFTEHIDRTGTVTKLECYSNVEAWRPE